MKPHQYVLLSLLLLASPPLHARMPQRIVSLAPSVTQSLYELGLEDRVTGISVYCPKGKTPKEIIGTVWEPNIEKILALSPGLVIATKEGNRKSAVEKLMEFGVPVHVIETDRSFMDICDHFLSLGRLLGRETAARDIIDRCRARMEAVKKETARRPPLSVFWEVGARPLFTISSKSFINDFNAYTNTVNVFADLAARYPQISREEVIRRDPDVILLVAMGDVTEQERSYWSRFPGMKAVRNKRIFVISSSDIFTPTPQTFAKGVEILSSLLPKEARR